jgi:hypothetical protein
MSPKMLSLEAAVVEAGVVDALAESGEATVEAVAEVFEFAPMRSPTSEPRSLRMLPLELVVEAGVEDTWAAESLVGVAVDAATAAGAEVEVEVVESPPSRLPSPELISPKMLPLEAAVVEAGVVEAVADSGEATVEAVVEVFEFTPRRSPKSEPTSPMMLPPELEAEVGVDDTWVDDSLVGATVEAATAAAGVEVEVAVAVEVELVESPPRRLPIPEPRSLSKLPLELVEAGADETWDDESTAAACLLVLPALEEAASELCWVLSVLAASVCLVVVVVVAVGSPPMVVVPVIRWVISGFFGSTEMVTTTISCPLGSWAATGEGVGVTSGVATELCVGAKLSKMLSRKLPGLLSALRALLRMVRLISLGK